MAILKCSRVDSLSLSAVPNNVNRGGETEPLAGDGGADRDRVFIDAVKSGDASKILSSYSDALETLRIMLAASTSFQTGKAVDL